MNLAKIIMSGSASNSLVTSQLIYKISMFARIKNSVVKRKLWSKYVIKDIQKALKCKDTIFESWKQHVRKDFHSEKQNIRLLNYLVAKGNFLFVTW